MSAFTHDGVRLGLALTLAGTCLTFAVFTIAALGLQREAIEKDAQIEAIHVTQSIAFGLGVRSPDESAQAWLERVASLHRRDVMIVDGQGHISADAGPHDLGQLYQGDAGEEFQRTLEDGRPRAFVVAGHSGRADEHRVVVAIREGGTPSGAIVGAVLLDYSAIRDDVLRQNSWRLGAVCAIGLFCMLLTSVPGLHVHGTLTRMAEQIRISREQLLLRVGLEREAAQRAEYLALHDALTGLPNRIMFSRLLRLSLEQVRRDGGGSLAVMFIDLDRFKNINDTLGHEAGDTLLVEVARRLTEALRTDDQVARLGGDEFAILVNDHGDPEVLRVVANRVIAAVARPYQLLDQDFRVTASVGVSVYPMDGLDEPSLMKHADNAMYRAKEQGKNRFAFYAQDHDPHCVERLMFETDLRRSLEENQFELHYQPKVECRSGRMTGVEALLRWRHPEFGLVLPSKFIPLAEETGLIVPIGRWVLRAACTQLVAWRRQGLAPLRVAVNLSGRQFTDERLLDDVRAILADTGAPPDAVEIEITESVLMSDVRKTREVLDAFRALSIKLSIDDFGTGYSSLSNLKRFPVDAIKVDRSFVRDLATNDEDKAIVECDTSP